MTISYTLALEDLVACGLHMQQPTAVAKRRALNVTVTWVSWVSWLFLVGYVVLAGSGVMRVVGFVIVLVVGIINHPSVRAHMLEQGLADHYGGAENAIFMGPRTLTLSEHGYVVAGPLSESRYPWSSVHKVARTDRHIFLYIAPIQAHTIPIHSTLKDQGDEIYRYLQQHIPADRFV